MQEPAPDLDAITNQSEASKRKPLMLRYRHRTLAQSKQLQLGFQAKWKISELVGSGCSNLQRETHNLHTILFRSNQMCLIDGCIVRRPRLVPKSSVGLIAQIQNQ